METCNLLSDKLHLFYNGKIYIQHAHCTEAVFGVTSMFMNHNNCM